LTSNGLHNHQARSVSPSVLEMEAPSKNAAAAEKNGAKINPKLVKAAPSHEVSLKIETKRKGYLLVTMYRSGSTLTGEMFNRNPDFLYYFEVKF
jgi:hypothetical protein